jgi:hypothetical protein
MLNVIYVVINEVTKFNSTIFWHTFEEGKKINPIKNG